MHSEMIKFFKTNRSNIKDSYDAHEIPSNARIAVQTLLSATIYDDSKEQVALSKFYEGDPNNKTYNISIFFDRIQVSC